MVLPRNLKLPVQAKFFKGPLDGQTRELAEAWDMVQYTGHSHTDRPTGDVQEFTGTRPRRKQTGLEIDISNFPAFKPAPLVVYVRQDWVPGFEQGGLIPYGLHQSSA